MIVLENVDAVNLLLETGVLSVPLADHLKKKVAALTKTFGTVEKSGLIGVLEALDKDLSGAGLPKELALIMPEWISRLELDDSIRTYYILYILSNNDQVVQVYIPQNLIWGALRHWLQEQPIENEQAEWAQADVEREEPF